MKAIHITSDLELELPKQLNEMFLKTSKLGIVHISYKMPCWVHDDNLNNIKKKFSEICKELQPYTIEFDRYKITKSSDYTIMIGAKERANPMSVQQKFLDGINDFCEAHIKSIYAKYESAFDPHITIAYDVKDDELISYLSKLVSPILIEAKVKSATLRITDGKNPGFTVIDEINCRFSSSQS